MNGAILRLQSFCVITLVLLGSCNSPAPKKIIATDEVQILKIAIDEIPKEYGYDTNKGMLFFRDSLISLYKDYDPKWCKYAIQKENFIKEANKDTLFIPILAKLMDSAKSELFDTSVIKSGRHYKLIARINKPEWQNRKKYPHGFIYYTFSPVAFNNTHTMACMYQTMYCGILCASGEFLFFRKLNGKWVIDGRGYGWVS
jgi:hypothetical protein